MMAFEQWTEKVLGYKVIIEFDSLKRLAVDLLEKANSKKILMVVDENIKELHRDYLMTLEENDNIAITCIHVGENSKSVERATDLWSLMAQLDFKRSDQMVAFGGGVVGDLVGFCAATYMRGISWIQVPTSLLAQVDSSVGGKVAINLREGKNLVGSFYNPESVYIDPCLLETLPMREWKSGLAEVLKYMMICQDEDIKLVQHWINQIHQAQINIDYNQLKDMILKCIAIKAAIVIEDFQESDVRRYLNFGHTIGHAIESQSRYTLSHGHCVLLGMWLACIINEHPITQWLETFMLLPSDIQLIKETNIGSWIEYMNRDKKATSKGLTFILLKRGPRVPERNISVDFLKTDIEGWMRNIIFLVKETCYTEIFESKKVEEKLIEWKNTKI